MSEHSAGDGSGCSTGGSTGPGGTARVGAYQNGPGVLNVTGDAVGARTRTAVAADAAYGATGESVRGPAVARGWRAADTRSAGVVNDGGTVNVGGRIADVVHSAQPEDRADRSWHGDEYGSGGSRRVRRDDDYDEV
jgi:hypothetical protein